MLFPFIKRTVKNILFIMFWAFILTGATVVKNKDKIAMMLKMADHADVIALDKEKVQVKWTSSVSDRDTTVNYKRIP